jgi:hypothetical protein
MTPAPTTPAIATVLDLAALQVLPEEDTTFDDLAELGLRPCAMTCWLVSCILTRIGGDG